MSASLISDAPPLLAGPSAKRLGIKFLILLVLLGGAITACLFIKPPAVMTEPGVVMQWPDEVMGFIGKDAPISEAEHALLPVDTEFAKKSYANAAGEHIGAQIVLSGAEHRSIHRPEICLTGQGWKVPIGQVISVPLKSGHKIDVMVLDISRPLRTQNGAVTELPALYLYFFVSKNAETARHFDRIAITNLDLLLHNKAHRWAYVILTAEILKGLTPNGKDRAQTLEMLKDFLREAAPKFLKSEMLPAAAMAPTTPAGGS